MRYYISTDNKHFVEVSPSEIAKIHAVYPDVKVYERYDPSIRIGMIYS